MIVVSFSIVGVAYSLFLALSTDVLTPLIFGARYVISLPIHTIICIIAIFRLLRGGMLRCTSLPQEEPRSWQR